MTFSGGGGWGWGDLTDFTGTKNMKKEGRHND